jgi:hypothetical protein
VKWFKHAFAIDSPDQIKLNESSELLSKINFRNSRLGSLIVTSRPSLENNESAQLTSLLRGYFDQIRNCLEVNRPQAAGLNRSMWQTYRWIDIRCRRSSEKSSKASVRTRVGALDASHLSGERAPGLPETRDRVVVPGPAQTPAIATREFATLASGCQRYSRMISMGASAGASSKDVSKCLSRHGYLLGFSYVGCLPQPPSYTSAHK